MQAKVLLIKKDKFETSSIDTIREIPIFVKKGMADETLTMDEYCDRVNANAIDTENFYSFSFVDTGEVEDIAMKQEDWHDIVINKELLVHITRNDTGYSIDLYRHFDEEDDELEHDYDDDLINSVTVWDDDLIEDDEEDD